ncbi:MAG: 30S ribosomal protein S17 [Elusimicrobia bacterium]|nr:30S ribosomal protein S17 [Elusimicrobiota bacterium]MBI3012354.1 30S ribosomal protein S17 [Elusimicrobiota bacterium]MBI4217726.1 30S ribosomal protein S17 [Elusimicrobiota bacterium]
MITKERVGVVLSDKMNKTRVVQVERRVRHPFYGKTLRVRKKFYAHDEKNESKAGAQVRIRETRPLSRLKRWEIVEILQKP